MAEVKIQLQEIRKELRKENIGRAYRHILKNLVKRKVME